jgi:hypothetical protein
VKVSYTADRMNLSYTPDQIRALMSAYHEIGREEHAAWEARHIQGLRPFHLTVNETRRRGEALRAAREKVQREFAKSRGWTVAKDFTVRMLLAGNNGKTQEDYGGGRPDYIDHPNYFREAVRPYRPIAILTHSYKRLIDVIREANRDGLATEVLPWSWYYPGACAPVLLTKRVVA